MDNKQYLKELMKSCSLNINTIQEKIDEQTILANSDTINHLTMIITSIEKQLRINEEEQDLKIKINAIIGDTNIIIETDRKSPKIIDEILTMLEKHQTSISINNDFKVNLDRIDKFYSE